MCKKLVSVELYDSARIAFRTLDYLRNETGMQWSMYKNAPDIYGRSSFLIYGMFENEDLTCARETVNGINDNLIFGDYE